MTIAELKNTVDAFRRDNKDVPSAMIMDQRRFDLIEKEIKEVVTPLNGVIFRNHDARLWGVDIIIWDDLDEIARRALTYRVGKREVSDPYGLTIGTLPERMDIEPPSF